MTNDAGARALLRHVVATIAYRGGKALRGAQPGFGEFRAGPGSRSAVEILGHVGDLFEWAIHLAAGEHVWDEAGSRDWDGEVERFFDGMGRLDAVLGSSTPLECSEERLFQGPFADALTHIGQIALLRRLHGAPVRGENYFKADVVSGRVGPDQAPPRREFD